jgi:hypothetical protein
LDQPDAALLGALGEPHLGASLLHGACVLGEMLHRPRAALQATQPLGSADDRAGPTLGSTSQARAGSRQQQQRHRTAGQGRACPCGRHHPSAPGAALYDPAPSTEESRAKHPRGQLPKKGPRQPTPKAHLENPTTRWQRLEVPWYGATDRQIEITTGTSVWFHNSLPPVSLRWVLIRDPLGEFDPQCLVCNEQTVSPEQMIQWFLLRWQVEVTFAEMRAHLGMETQRQWSEKAIERTTPALFGLFSVVTLCAQELLAGGAAPIRRAAWYDEHEATFSDLLALVRQQLWPITINRTSTPEADIVLIPRPLLQRMTGTLAFAA